MLMWVPPKMSCRVRISATEYVGVRNILEAILEDIVGDTLEDIVGVPLGFYLRIPFGELMSFSRKGTPFFIHFGASVPLA